MKKLRTIIIGDVHGCIDEFTELLKKVQYDNKTDEVILVGDLIDRGPDSVAVVRKCRELKLKCTLGNHEIKFLNWAKNSNSYPPDDRKHYYYLNKDDIAYMNAMPLYIEISHNLYVIHGGAEPGIPIKDQSEDSLCFRRYTDLNGDFLSLKKVMTEQVKDYKFWTEFWTGPESIIYGHNVNLSGPKIDKYNDDVYCYGIDTGACFGGYLTAMILDNNKIDFVKVKSKEYCKIGFF